MHTKDAIRQSIDMADFTFGKYLDDLDDAEFLHRPIAGMNHIAWQMGHLIETENKNMGLIKPGACPTLPEGFREKHGREGAKSEDPKDFHTKAEYMALWKAQRDASRAILDSLTDADLDAPSPESMRNFVPTVGMAIHVMAGMHPMMHAGQFVAVRRSLGKPIAM